MKGLVSQNKYEVIDVSKVPQSKTICLRVAIQGQMHKLNEVPSD